MFDDQDENLLEEEQEDQDEQEEEQELEQPEEKAMQAVNSRLVAKTKKAKAKIKQRGNTFASFPVLHKDEKQLLNQIKHMKKPPQGFKPKAEVLEIEQLMMQARARWFSNYGPKMGTSFLFVGLILIIFIVVMLLVGMISSIFGEDSGKMSSQFGASGADFYGVRTIYKDDEQAEIDIVAGYIDILAGVANAVGGKEPTVEITLQYPEYNQIGTFIANQGNGLTHTYNLVNDMASIMYQTDNPEQQTPTNFKEKLAGIKYFGIDLTKINQVSEVISSYINTNLLYAAKDADQSVPADIAETVTSCTQAYLNANVVGRTEKYYVKDYIFSAGGDMLQNVEQQNYVAFIYMARHQLTLSKLSVMVRDVDDSFNIVVDNNGANVQFVKEQILYKQEDGVDAYQFEAKFAVTISAFEDFDIDNADYLADGKSLYNILVDNSVNINQYLVKVEQDLVEEEQANVYTYKPSSTMVNFDAQNSFSFADEVSTN